MIYLQELIYDVDQETYVAVRDADLPSAVDASNLAAYCETTYGPPLDVAHTDGADGGRETIGWTFELPTVSGDEFGITHGELVVIPMVRTADDQEPLLPFLARQRSMLETAHQSGQLDRLVIVDGVAPWPPERDDSSRIGNPDAFPINGTPDPAESEENDQAPAGRDEPRMREGLKRLLDERLPLNRKERFFTGTVFPMIVASDGFEHLGRLLSLCGVPPRETTSDPSATDVQFFTEYGYAESRIGDAATRLPTAPAGRDTPDILLYFDASPPLLLALEAKMYDVPSRTRMGTQIQVQSELLAGLGRDLSVLAGESVEVFHAALLPSQLAATLGPLDVSVITWQSLLDAYADVAPPYWSEMLSEALRRYPDLVPKTGSGLNSDAKMYGASIVERAKDDTLPYACIGRQGGLGGTKLRTDVENGTWKTHNYEVCFDDTPPNDNWFTVEAFLARLAEHATPPES